MHFPDFCHEPDTLLAVTEDGRQIFHRDLHQATQTLGQTLGRQLVFLLCENTPGTLLGYLSCLQIGAVPLLLDGKIAPGLFSALVETYQPAYIYAPNDLDLDLPPATVEIWDSALHPTGHPGPELHPDLALLLTTSGSTGSPKLVRLSEGNLVANARSIAQYLELSSSERAITSLPMSYSYGMSIVNTHALMGATLLLTKSSVMERSFWDMMIREKATSLAGVPYTYQMLHRLGLTSMDLPDLRYCTQAGGKLSLALHKVFAQWAQDTHRRFYVMYGQTEAAPRMGYLPAEKAVEKQGSMGISVPGGRFDLLDESDQPITTPDTQGELVYHGENVSMGYAQTPQDLLLGDEWGGVLHTGDMAQFDQDGFFYITGRKKRFVKLFGNRVNLDQVERLLGAKFPQANFACAGRDDRLAIFLDSDQEDLPDLVKTHLRQEVRLPLQGLRVAYLPELPKNEAGKLLYSQLPELD